MQDLDEMLLAPCLSGFKKLQQSSDLELSGSFPELSDMCIFCIYVADGTCPFWIVVWLPSFMPCTSLGILELQSNAAGWEDEGPLGSPPHTGSQLLPQSQGPEWEGTEDPRLWPPLPPLTDRRHRGHAPGADAGPRG